MVIIFISLTLIFNRKLMTSTGKDIVFCFSPHQKIYWICWSATHYALHSDLRAASQQWATLQNIQGHDNVCVSLQDLALPRGHTEHLEQLTVGRHSNVTVLLPHKLDVQDIITVACKLGASRMHYLLVSVSSGEIIIAPKVNRCISHSYTLQWANSVDENWPGPFKTELHFEKWARFVKIMLGQLKA